MLATVMTVQGPVSSDKLGITLAHEHLIVDTTSWFVEPKEAHRKHLVDAPITLDILWELRRDFVASKTNLLLTDVDTVIQELMDFKKLGGGSLVEVTVPGVGRNPAAMKTISQATGVNVICGSGWYFDKTHPDYVRRKTADELADIIVGEITKGIENSGIKAGIIGELGTSEPLTEMEKKVLQAGARAQRKIGAALTLHPYPFGKKAHVYLDILEREGADFSKVYISHMDATCYDLAYQTSVLETGVSVSYDTFGVEAYADSMFPGAGYRSDRERISAIVSLVKSGYEKQIMMSQDVCLKMQLKRFGGNGYSYILETVVPRLKYLGLADRQINTMLVENPRRILAF